MRDAKEVMDEFLKTWNNMKENQFIQLNLTEFNYEEVRKCFFFRKENSSYL